MISVTVKAESRDATGKIVAVVEKPANSFVEQFLRIMWTQAGSVTGTIRNIAGAWISVDVFAYNFDTTAAIGNFSKGIVVGSVPAPVTINQATLHGRIPHGSVAPGQLLYQAVSWNAPTGNTGFWQFQASRVFLNRSGQTATIAEVGIYSAIRYGTVMLDRTVLSPPVVVPDGGQVTIVYTFGGTVR
ncbi:MAG: hypothetical protein QXP81_09820 [Nitrososphaerota archaeon]